MFVYERERRREEREWERKPGHKCSPGPLRPQISIAPTLTGQGGTVVPSPESFSCNTLP